MNIVVAGATGFIGHALIPRLVREGHSVVALTRNPASARDHMEREVVLESWDAASLGTWSDRLAGADAVINLAGESSGSKLWTPAQKRKMLRSRLDATSAIVESMRRSGKKPALLINASAVGYYGNVPEGDVTEDHPPGAGFLANLCVQWENEAKRAEELGIRVALLRMGLVLGEKGGALARMVLPFKLLAGGTLGSGRQWVPWIHRDDVVGAMLHILRTPALGGPLNVTAPSPARMSEFSRELGRALHRPSWTRVPEPVLRALLGEMSTIVLTGQRVIPTRLMSSGYHFFHPSLSAALESVLA
jgi:uncharacterized protein (TIGR01777 family)